MFGAPSFAVRPAQEGLPDQLILAHPAGYDEQTSIFGDHDLWYTVFE